jgi:hypothetical protein
MINIEKYGNCETNERQAMALEPEYVSDAPLKSITIDITGPILASQGEIISARLPWTTSSAQRSAHSLTRRHKQWLMFW